MSELDMFISGRELLQRYGRGVSRQTHRAIRRHKEYDIFGRIYRDEKGSTSEYVLPEEGLIYLAAAKGIIGVKVRLDAGEDSDRGMPPEGRVWAEISSESLDAGDTYWDKLVSMLRDYEAGELAIEDLHGYIGGNVFTS